MPKFEIEGSLKKVLLRDYPGAKTVQEAIQLARKDNPIINQRAAQVMDEYQTMHNAIDQITKECLNFDIETLDLSVRDRLSRMKLNTTEDVLSWRDEWLRLLRGEW